MTVSGSKPYESTQDGPTDISQILWGILYVKFRLHVPLQSLQKKGTRKGNRALGPQEQHQLETWFLSDQEYRYIAWQDLILEIRRALSSLMKHGRQMTLCLSIGSRSMMSSLNILGLFYAASQLVGCLLVYLQANRKVQVTFGRRNGVVFRLRNINVISSHLYHY